MNEHTVTAEIVAEHGLTREEYTRIEAAMGRAPNLLELGIYSVMWSEHCSYKSSRRHLKKLPTEAPWVIQGPGENAGVIDIGDGQAAIFKMESHNHPSFIEPYQGAATGVGGILRDVFTMGARPVANMNALRFGAPEHPKTRHLVEGVVAGIGGYGNCVGVPTVGGETNFDPAYNGNILVNAMTVGVADTDRIFYSAAAGIGNPVVYVGAKTGRDGIHGATMASAEFSEDTEEKRPTVQVGDPFTEKLLIEACLELMSTDAIVAIQDMGAAGLTSSSVEMASKGAVGLRLDLERVPQRESGMVPYEMMLSESQERMLMVLKPGREAEAEAIFRKWDLDFAVIGEIVEGRNLTLTFHGETVGDIPVPSLVDDAPDYDRPHRPTPARDRAEVPAPGDPAGDLVDDLAGAIKRLIGGPSLASRRWIWEQYDSQVMADTVAGPGGDAALVRVHGTDKALAISTDVTPRYCYVDPFEGGKQAVAETWRNLTATGATPLAITNCLNFGNPERPDIMGQFVGCIDGMAAACAALDYPVVSGNVSLYNETNGVGILPTPAIGGVGLVRDVSARAAAAFSGTGQTILLIGKTADELGCSLYQRDILGVPVQGNTGAPPRVDLTAEKSNGDFVRGLIGDGTVTCCHDLSDGGLIAGVVAMALAGGVGAHLRLPDTLPLHVTLFSETQARYLVAVEDTAADDVLARAGQAGIPAMRIGRTDGDSVRIEGNGDNALAVPIDLPLVELRQLSEAWLPDLMGD